MKKYYYTDGVKNFGPFTLEELKEKNITKETLVWFQNIEDWTPAVRVSELNELFNILPPPIKMEKQEFAEMLILNNATGSKERVTMSRYNEITKYYGKEKFTILSYIDEYGNIITDNSKILVEKNRPPKTYLTESILVTLFCCMPFGIAGIVNAAKVESRFYAGDLEGAHRSSGEAKKWTTVSFWVGLGFGVIYLIVVIASVASES